MDYKISKIRKTILFYEFFMNLMLNNFVELEHTSLYFGNQKRIKI